MTALLDYLSRHLLAVFVVVSILILITSYMILMVLRRSRTKDDIARDESEEEPGAFKVKIHCPHCGEDWYVVWDRDPT